METVRRKLFGANYSPYDGLQLENLDLQGWASKSPAFESVLKQYEPKLIIEVGTWKGGSAVHMAEVAKNLYGNSNFEIVCIDTFLGSVEHWDRTSFIMNFKHGRPTLYDVFLSNVVRTSNDDVITPFPVDSHNGWQTLLNFNVEADLIYIDGGHDYDAVKRDIEGYKKILKPGGVLLLDDGFHQPIIDACNECIPGCQYLEEKIIWVK